ncbi:MAG: LysR substrate-binding domain-containing protein, partial [Myxococcota bacterium]
TPRFDPATASRRFRVVMFDMATVTLLPRLIARLHELAPGVDLEVVPMNVDRVTAWLRAEEVDAAIMVPREAAADIRTRPLFRDELVSVVRDGHPLAKRDQVSLDEFSRWPHATIRLTGREPGSLDAALKEAGVERRVSLQVPYFLAAPALVSATDFVMSIPRSAAVAFGSHWPIARFPPPLPAHQFTVHLLWSRTQDADPAQQWFRSELTNIAETTPGIVAGPSALAEELRSLAAG